MDQNGTPVDTTAAQPPLVTTDQLAEPTTASPGATMPESPVNLEESAEDAAQRFAARVIELEREVQNWTDSAAEYARGSDYYQGLLDQIGQSIGDKARTADDGSISDSILRAKLPELVKELCEQKPVLAVDATSIGEKREDVYKALLTSATGNERVYIERILRTLKGS